MLTSYGGPKEEHVSISMLVIMCGIIGLLICLAAFVTMIMNLDVVGGVSRWVTAHANTISKMIIMSFIFGFFFTVTASLVAITYPQRLGKYVTNIIVPLWGNLTDY